MSGSNLPEHWIPITLDDALLSIVGGGTPSKANARYFQGDIPWMSVKDMNKNILEDTEDHISEEAVKNSSTNIIPAGTPIIATRMSLGKIIIANFDSAINQDLKALFPASGVERNFLIGWYRSISKHIESLGTGTTVKGIRLEVLRALEFPLPPLAEQKVIAEKLDTLLAQVETTKARLERIPDILKRFRQSVLAAAVSGRLTEEWRGKNRHPNDVLQNIQKWKNDWIKNNQTHNEVKRVFARANEYLGPAKLINNELPESWQWSQLEDCVLMIVDCHNKTAPYTESGIALIRTSNIRDGRFIWEDLKFVSESTYEYWSRRCPPEHGDIIFTREAPMGEAAIIPANHKLCLGQRTMLIRPIEPLFSAKFLLMALMDPEFKKRSEEIAVGTGVKHFRVGDVSKLMIPIPSTEEQTEIVRRVEQLFAFADTIEQKANAALERVNNLTQSILAKAFRGELTADWRAANPDLIRGENSAAALLEKIKEEREAANSKPNKRKAKA